MYDKCRFWMGPLKQTVFEFITPATLQEILKILCSHLKDVPLISFFVIKRCFTKTVFVRI